MYVNHIQLHGIKKIVEIITLRNAEMLTLKNSAKGEGEKKKETKKERKGSFLHPVNFCRLYPGKA